jgi:primase-polymerase (primpol)-like protein
MKFRIKAGSDKSEVRKVLSYIRKEIKRIESSEETPANGKRLEHLYDVQSDLEIDLHSSTPSRALSDRVHQWLSDFLSEIESTKIAAIRLDQRAIQLNFKLKECMTLAQQVTGDPKVVDSLRKALSSAAINSKLLLEE